VANDRRGLDPPSGENVDESNLQGCAEWLGDLGFVYSAIFGLAEFLYGMLAWRSMEK
jgi:hypothetical protein